jgi:hypothetical protein
MRPCPPVKGFRTTRPRFWRIRRCCAFPRPPRFRRAFSCYVFFWRSPLFSGLFLLRLVTLFWRDPFLDVLFLLRLVTLFWRSLALDVCCRYALLRFSGAATLWTIFSCYALLRLSFRAPFGASFQLRDFEGSSMARRARGGHDAIFFLDLRPRFRYMGVLAVRVRFRRPALGSKRSARAWKGRVKERPGIGP